MSAKQKSDILYALRWAFPYTVPIFMGFWFIGLAYGKRRMRMHFHQRAVFTVYKCVHYPIGIVSVR